MDESERIQRIKENRSLYEGEINDLDEQFANRIAALLNHPQIDQYCMVDAYYYDFSVIPRGIQERLQLWRDCYFIFGITTEGEMVSKWVDRWDLDSDDPVENGEVKHRPRIMENDIPPEIKQHFYAKILSAPVSDYLIKLFGRNDRI